MSRLKELREEAGLSKNHLAQLAGLSASHISGLENKIENARRDTLIFVSLYICPDLESINELLADYNQDAITALDATYFVQAAYRRKFNGTQIIYSERLSLYTLLLGMDNLGGNEILVHRRLSNRFAPENYLTLRNQKRGINDTVLNRIIEAFLEQRQKKLKENLTKDSEYFIHHMICEECFTDYIKEANESEEEKKYITAMAQNLLFFIKGFDNFNFSLLSECPKFNFEIKSFDDEEKNDIVFLLGQGIEKHEKKIKNQQDQKKENPESPKYNQNSLYGFVTDSTQFLSAYKREYKRLQECIAPEYKGKENTVQRIIKLIEDNTEISLDKP